MIDKLGITWYNKIFREHDKQRVPGVRAAGAGGEKTVPEHPKKDPQEEELDRFWDIDALLPPRRPTPKSNRTDIAEIVLEPKSTGIPDGGAPCGFPLPPHVSSGQEGQIPPDKSLPSATHAEQGMTVVHTASAVGAEPVIHRYIHSHTAEEAANAPKPDEEYVPQSALLHKVRIFRWKSSFPYYEDFADTARKLLPVQGKSCRRVPFFSYVPQYAQMDRAQLEWYLWLRECVRKGETPETDYSYVLLLVYEIINLSGWMDPLEAQTLLCRLWSGYREHFAQLDSYLPEWICDYSLIHRLPPPVALSGVLLTQAMLHCSLKEFYVGGGPDDGYIRALLAFCSNYDYRKSKFCTPENRKLFDDTVLAVLRQVTDLLSESGKLFSASGMEDSRLTRDAYSGALCSYRMKRKIEISYCSFSRSHELRFLITDVVKYTENQLRACLGVRSRLTIYALPVPIRSRIDEYTAHLIPVRRTEKKRREPEADFERLYDYPAKPLSLSNAAEIERASWDTTQKLVEAFGGKAEPPEPTPDTGLPQSASLTAPAESKPMQTPEPDSCTGEPEQAGLACALAPYRDFLRAVLAEDAGRQRTEAGRLGMLPDAVADAVNELAAELTGDILLEDSGGGYGVLADYRELLNTLV